MHRISDDSVMLGTGLLCVALCLLLFRVLRSVHIVLRNIKLLVHREQCFLNIKFAK